ncbi:uncharacterized protein AMSG_09632 [Thecamonas trahens ATCC 50062]|uniref:F-box domain-containing protein n=1 Tax=Thecamonas trahens ATCC 50062 TaxID=461836 RepID=A0A0L0DNU4_THETB|nr:hypothetical protein AMSG_09632 [Thecamonas trahens ATCC 50062]KNC53984.1 hypothetical protein AMSG_09632 [Thecamonas trahens ATCC 50062]|eukprot:XP_013754186.1 hypothetical protein AMSG_09632 [Thecamonas trahens ATCC 50062]
MERIPNSVATSHPNLSLTAGKSPRDSQPNVHTVQSLRERYRETVVMSLALPLLMALLWTLVMLMAAKIDGFISLHWALVLAPLELVVLLLPFARTIDRFYIGVNHKPRRVRWWVVSESLAGCLALAVAGWVVAIGARVEGDITWPWSALLLPIYLLVMGFLALNCAWCVDVGWDRTLHDSGWHRVTGIQTLMAATTMALALPTFIVFLGLKLHGTVAWNWWLVFAPLLIAMAVPVIGLIGYEIDLYFDGSSQMGTYFATCLAFALPLFVFVTLVAALAAKPGAFSAFVLFVPLYPTMLGELPDSYSSDLDSDEGLLVRGEYPACPVRRHALYLEIRVPSRINAIAGMLEGGLPSRGRGESADEFFVDSDDECDAEADVATGNVTIAQLPAELMVEIFAHLDLISLVRCSAVSVRWRKWSREPWLWQPFLSWDGMQAAIVAVGMAPAPPRTSIMAQICIEPMQHEKGHCYAARFMRARKQQRAQNRIDLLATKRRQAAQGFASQSAVLIKRRQHEEIKRRRTLAKCVVVGVTLALIWLTVVLAMGKMGGMIRLGWWVVLLPLATVSLIPPCIPPIQQWYIARKSKHVRMGVSWLVAEAMVTAVCVVVASWIAAVGLRADGIVTWSWPVVLIPLYLMTLAALITLVALWRGDGVWRVRNWHGRRDRWVGASMVASTAIQAVLLPLGVVFLALRLGEVVAWTWWIALAPLLGFFTAPMLGMLAIEAGGYCAYRRRKPGGFWAVWATCGPAPLLVFTALAAAKAENPTSISASVLFFPLGCSLFAMSAAACTILSRDLSIQCTVLSTLQEPKYVLDGSERHPWGVLI